MVVEVTLGHKNGLQEKFLLDVQEVKWKGWHRSSLPIYQLTSLVLEGKKVWVMQPISKPSAKTNDDGIKKRNAATIL